MSARNLVIVGASLAGVRAAEGARAHGWTGRITMIGDEPHVPYDRPPLSKAALESELSPDLPMLRRPEIWDALDVDLHTSTAALGVDAGARRVHTSTGDVDFDALVVATGSRPRSLAALDGIGGVHQLRSFDDALAVRGALDTAEKLTVFGAGFIGSEVASAAVVRGIEVTMVNASTRPLARHVGPQAADMLLTLHHTAGVRTILGGSLVDITVRDNQICNVHLDTGDRLGTDAVVVGIGAEPSTDWLRGSDIELDPISGGVRCDATMATSAPAVWAAGDVASVDAHPGGHWTTAVATGFVAGANAAGAHEVHAGVPFAWSSWYGHRIQMVGRTVDAEEVIVADGHVEYRDSGRVVGGVGIDKPGPLARLRRDLLATAQPTGPTTAA